MPQGNRVEASGFNSRFLRGSLLNAKAIKRSNKIGLHLPKIIRIKIIARIIVARFRGLKCSWFDIAAN